MTFAIWLFCNKLSVCVCVYIYIYIYIYMQYRSKILFLMGCVFHGDSIPNLCLLLRLAKYPYVAKRSPSTQKQRRFDFVKSRCQSTSRRPRSRNITACYVSVRNFLELIPIFLLLLGNCRVKVQNWVSDKSLSVALRMSHKIWRWVWNRSGVVFSTNTLT
jgi:hypothetical protein